MAMTAAGWNLLEAIYHSEDAAMRGSPSSRAPDRVSEVTGE